MKTRIVFHRLLGTLLIILAAGSWLALPGHAVSAKPLATFSDCATQTQIPPTECAALVALYTNTDGLHWTNHTGWMSDDNPCNWYGVACSGTVLHVTSLFLSNNNLSGSIPAAVGDLTYLTSLGLYNNVALTGPIPPELGNLTSLTVLYLFGNQLNGSIPDQLGNLTALTTGLYLNNNQLSGPIPASLGNLTNLISLNLNTNQLSDPIPPDLGSLDGTTGLTNLQFLDLHGNQLSGSIPAELGGLTKLQELHLDHNALTGSFTPELGKLAQLQLLYLVNNQLEGDVPVEIANLPSLTPTTGLSLSCRLTASDPTVIAFLDTYASGWEAKQCLVDVDTFTATSPSASRTIPIPDFHVTDPAANVIGYMITESADDVPALEDTRWSGSKPTTYPVIADGTYLLYPWAKDDQGYVSRLFPSPRSVIVDTTPPTVVSILRADPDYTALLSVHFTVTFSEAVTGVDVNDFGTSPNNAVSGESITGVSGGPTVYTVTVNTGSGSGALRLDLVDNQTIVDVALNHLSGGDYSFGQPYTVNKSNADLSGLVLSTGALNTAFDPGTMTYTQRVDYSVANLTSVTPSPADPLAVVAITLNGLPLSDPANPTNLLDVAPATNILTIVVTSQDGTATTTYTVTITRDKSTNADLSGLVLSTGAFTPAFDGATIAYTQPVSNDFTSLTVTPTTVEATASVAIVFHNTSAPNPIPLAVGPNTITIIVTAPYGNTKTYTVTVTRAPSSNADLGSLVLNKNGGIPAPIDLAAPLSLPVANAVTSLTVTPTTAEPNATIKVNSTPVASGGTSGTIPLAVYNNTITIVVTAQDGTTKPYIVTVTRAPSSDANLSNLVFNTGLLKPLFSSATTSYTQLVANDVSGLIVTPTVEDTTATVTVNDKPAVSGKPSDVIVLDVGQNTITTAVTAQDGTTIKTYTVIVTRANTATFTSVGTQDGWVLESSETSNKGGTLNLKATTFNVGDDSARRQYVGILSFKTAVLPAHAVITMVTLAVNVAKIVGGGNPVVMFRGFMVDVKKGTFGSPALALTDFQAATTKSYGPFKPALVSFQYRVDLTAASSVINTLPLASGLTQLRLRFFLDDNNNSIANYLSIYSGEAAAVRRPQLIVQYYVP